MGGLEIVLDKGRSECTDVVATSWRDRAPAAVGTHLLEMLVAAEEFGEGHENWAVCCRRASGVRCASTLEGFVECLNVIGTAPL